MRLDERVTRKESLSREKTRRTEVDWSRLKSFYPLTVMHSPTETYDDRRFRLFGSRKRKTHEHITRNPSIFDQVRGFSIAERQEYVVVVFWQRKFTLSVESRKNEKKTQSWTQK